MPILKNKLIKDYTMIPNWIINDKKISDSAFRLLAYLYSKPDNWNVVQKNVAKDLGVGTTTITRRLNELKKHNAIEIVKVGFIWEYHLHSEYQTTDVSSSPNMVNPKVVTPDMVNPKVGVHNKTDNNKTEYTNTDINIYMSELENIFKNYYTNISKRFNKKQVKDKLKIKLKDYSFKTIRNGFENYIKVNHKENNDIQFIKAIHSFIMNEMFNDYLDVDLDAIKKPSNNNNKTVIGTTDQWYNKPEEPVSQEEEEELRKILKNM